VSWNARRILREIADNDLRHKVLRAFWRYADPTQKAVAIVQLSKALHFRDETIRKMTADKKTELLASRAAAPEFEQTLETALMQYHTHEANTMMAAFLDRWGVPHKNGSIESNDYKTPSADAVRSAVRELTFEPRQVALYLASAGLLMGGGWADATFPVVDELLASAEK
jgi:hypothetical protein